MPAKRESKKAYLKRRKDRVRKLYLEGLEPCDIAAKLVADGTIATVDESLDSPVRLVRGDVAAIRRELLGARVADSKPEVAEDSIDVLSRKLKRLRKEYDRQQMIADGEPMELCAVSRVPPAACANSACLARDKHTTYIGPAVGVVITDTPQGQMTSFRALWPAGVRQKAAKDAALLAEKIAEAEDALAEKREALSESGEKQEAGGLTIIESEKSIADLIASNLSVN